MMTTDINHHLTDALLMAYSGGVLPEAFNLVVATHISLCDECRARLESYDAVGGALLAGANSDVAALEEDSFSATMRLIADGANEQIRTSKKSSAKADPTLPAPLADYVRGGMDAVDWKPVGLGVRQAILPTSKEASVRLLHIPAGTAVPDHGHRGMELTLVLRGAFQDEHDYFARGDIEIANEELNHTPVADIAEDCICLAATDAPLRFNSWIPRLAQPFLRI